MRPLVGPVDVGFAELTLEDYDELSVPRLHITTRREAIDDEGISLLLSTLDAIFARGEPLTVLYDLRVASLPSRRQINLALDWISDNSHLLDRHLQGIAILLSSMLVRGVVNLVLTLCTPPQPNAVLADEPDAFNFARDKCTVIKVWVPAKKLKRQKSHGPSVSKGSMSAREASAREDESPGTASAPATPRQGLLSPRSLSRSRSSL